MTRSSLLLRLALGLGILAVTALPEAAEAKDCGGGIACACGDRVVAAATLSQSLNNCLGDGLVLAAGSIDCLGRQIAGPGDQTDAVGIRIAGFNSSGATGAVVRNCRVRNFGRGIEIDSGSGNTLDNNVVFNNHIGIWLGDGTSGNHLTGNHIRDNRDEGVHVGASTHDNVIDGNEFVNNSNENLYLIDTTNNQVTGNELRESGSASILLKNASDNTFTDNQVFDRPIHVRGGSSNNDFVGNGVSSYYRFQANEESAGSWTYPHHNVVEGGAIAKASTCFEFEGAHDNTVTGVEVDTCRAFEEKERGGLVPFGNSVDVIRIDIGNARHSGQRRSASLRFAGSSAGLDRFKIDLRGLIPDTSFDPLHEDVYCSLVDFQGTILSFFLPAGSLEPRGDQMSYIDSKGLVGGLRRLDLREMEDGRWRIRLTGKTQIQTADYPLMTISCQIGDDIFTFNDFWDELKRGWNLRVQP